MSKGKGIGTGADIKVEQPPSQKRESVTQNGGVSAGGERAKTAQGSAGPGGSCCPGGVNTDNTPMHSHK